MLLLLTGIFSYTIAFLELLLLLLTIGLFTKGLVEDQHDVEISDFFYCNEETLSCALTMRLHIILKFDARSLCFQSFKS